MNLHIALAVAVLSISGAAQAQTVTSSSIDRVSVRIDGRPMSTIRAELFRAAETVCRSEALYAPYDTTCVQATYGRALTQARRVRTAEPTRIASR